MEDEAEIYEGVRAHFPLTFGKQSKPVTPLESIHNATRRSTTSDDAANGGDSNKGFPSFSSSSKAWLDSLKNPSHNSRNRSNPKPSRQSDDAMVGPPRPMRMDDDDDDDEEEEEEEEDRFIGPPRLAAVEEEDEEDGEMIGPPLPPPGSGLEDSDEEEGYDGEEEGKYRIPLSNEIVLKGHTKVVSALAVDHSGSRVLSGSYDYTVRMYDFQGMNSRLQSFRQLEPFEGHQVRKLSWSPTADRFLCVTGSAQAKIYDRDGLTLGEFVKGDMYIRDLKNTKGHISGLTCGEWHPKTKETILTSSEDGSLRIWDVNDFKSQKQRDHLGRSGNPWRELMEEILGAFSFLEGLTWRGDLEGSSGSGTLGGELWEEILALSSLEGITWRGDLKGSSGSETLERELLEWGDPGSQGQTPPKGNVIAQPEFDIFYCHSGKQELVIKPKLARPGRVPVTTCTWDREGKSIAGGIGDGSIQIWNLKPGGGSRPDIHVEKGHSDDITALKFSSDGQILLSRSFDDSLKVWDLRKMKEPLRVFNDLPNHYAQTNIGFSPDEQLFLTGTSVERDSTTGGLLCFYDRAKLELVSRVGVSPTCSVVQCAWHPKLNQIFVTSGDKSQGGTHILYDPTLSERGALVCVARAPRKKSIDDYEAKPVIHNPHALPLFRDQPVASNQGGLIKETWMEEDPREAILKYADAAAKDPKFIAPAYAQTQPEPVFAKSDSEDEEK
ncbi:transducin/WD40 repeat-like superfamily protein [Actinidia rufa]|uniref:Transducin/WD40 repeat-like superfamily protein n=1 Tax=Actinidia rufa TaxID=165716 RepID=A0A7J0HAQ5_9ERIC|nr:transducin/WD40 repeat-like superfamily protein [Actinidia rufa]